MTKFLALFIKILVTLPMIAFLFYVTLSNRDQVLKLNWSPFNDAAALSLPVILFVMLVLGFVWGSLILWSNTFALRAERRVLKKQVATLENLINVKQMENERLLGAKAREVHVPTPRIAAPEIL